MSTMVVRMECNPEFHEEVVRHLRQDVVVWALEQPGFRGGSWHVSEDGTRAIGVVGFATIDAAETAAAAPRGYHDPRVPFRVVGVDIYEQVATSAPGNSSAATAATS